MKGVIMALLLLLSAVQAMTPEDFNSRMENYKILNEKNLIERMPYLSEFDQEYYPAPTANENPRMAEWLALVEKTKSDYRLAYEAKASGNAQQAENYYEIVTTDFEALKGYTYNSINLEPLVNVIKLEFGKPTPTIGNVIVAPNTYTNPAPSATTIVRLKAPAPSTRLLPTLSPEQMRGKKTVWGALWDVLYDNGLIIGAFFVGILVIYGLYHKDEDESSLA